MSLPVPYRAPPPLVDAQNQPLRQSASAHFAASGTTVEMRDWHPSRGSADTDLLPELGTIRDRSRDLSRNSGIAAGAVRTETDNVIGAGLRLQVTPEFRALGRSRAWAAEFSTAIEAAWRGWAEGPDFDCDALGARSFHGLTRLAQMSEYESGEILAVPLWLNEPGRAARTAIQLIEPDRLSNPTATPESTKFRGGIERNRLGRPTAYHIRSAHPGDSLMAGLLPATGAATWTRIPARSRWGRRRIIHAFHPQRPGQSRGRPRLTPIVERLKMMDRYEKMEVQSAVVNAMFAAAITTPLDPNAIAEAMGAEGLAGYQEARAQYHDETRFKIDHARLLHLYPGEELKTIAPGHPQQQFGAFIDTVMNEIAAGLNLPKELLMRDFSRSNYSSARAALLEAWRYFMVQRAWLVEQWATPVFTLWLEEKMNGPLGRELDVPDFYQHKTALTRTRWIGPARGWIDPAREAKAAEIRVNNGLSTLEAEAAEQGQDFQELIDQQQRESEQLDARGLPNPYRLRGGIATDDPDADPLTRNLDDAPDPDSTKKEGKQS
jgi:lambda family phage portal protein